MQRAHGGRQLTPDKVFVDLSELGLVIVEIGDDASMVDQPSISAALSRCQPITSE
jgi:hypothetical protein